MEPAIPKRLSLRGVVTVRRVLVVGAGQSGLQLARGLLAHGYQVTVRTARSAAAIRTGRIMSTVCMFDHALQHERALGLDFWQDEAVQVGGLGVTVGGEIGERTIDWHAPLDAPAQSVEMRLKLSRWLEVVEELGATVEVGAMTVAELDRRAKDFDLVLVAAGRGELAELFPRDPAESPYDAPQRRLAGMYVTGIGPRAEHRDLPSVRCNLIPELGEVFVLPGHTHAGLSHGVLVEAIPGGPWDRFGDVRDSAEHLSRTKEIFQTYLPWEYERWGSVELVDDNATLRGGFAPTVRKPVGHLPSGARVLGMGDSVVLNDPLNGQGANAASECAHSYLKSIVAHGDRAFEEDFMLAAFADFWAYAEHPTRWTNAMLQPPPDFVIEVLEAAPKYPALARRFVNGFNDPKDVMSWLMAPDTAKAYLDEVAGRAA